MIALEPHPQGTILPVRAQAGARRNSVSGEHNGQLKVAVTQVAEKGKANEAIIGVLAAALDLKRSQIELLSGVTAAQKRFLVRLSQAELASRVATAVATSASRG